VDLALHCTTYTQALQVKHIRIVDRDDELICQFSPFGIYSQKVGYIHLNTERHLRDPLWWSKSLWKVHYPLRERIFIWSLIVNKVPTWDKMQIRHMEGLGWCSLCKLDNENSLHLFLLYPFVIHIWKEVVWALGKKIEMGRAFN
jgi:hypothetical protein